MKRYLIHNIFAVICTVILAQDTTAISKPENEDYGCDCEGTLNTSTVSEDDDETSQDKVKNIFEDDFSNIYVPEPQDRELSNILWKKTIWRIIDMREQVNFPLYYPLQENNGQKNLFTIIFELLMDGKIDAYGYGEGKREDFSEENKLTTEKVLEETKIDIYDTGTDDDGNPKFIVDESDIPSSDVLKFYIKEVWYFDGMESCMKFKIEAIAPQLYFTDQDGKAMKAVLYWIPFDELRPWLAKQPVVINNKNSTSFISYDDLFQKRRFVGHIFKEDNIQNRALIDYCNTPEEVRSEQIRIENEILNFESDLWEF